MATRREVAFFNSDGTGATAATPVFAAYKDKAGTNRTAPSSFTHIGQGVFTYLPSDADEAAGCVAVITAAGKFPLFQFDAIFVPTGTTPFAAIMLEDPAGVVWAGAAPTGSNVSAYAQLDNTAATAPTLTACVAPYLYTITPTAPQLAAGGVGFKFDAPAGALGTAAYAVIPGVSGGGGGSVVAPVVSNFVPSLATPIDPSQALSFDVTVSDGTPLAKCSITVELRGLKIAETVYDGSVFEDTYIASSSVTTITNGLRFVVKRLGGWPAAPGIKVMAVSTSGQVNN